MRMKAISRISIVAVTLGMATPALARELTVVSWGGAVQKAQSTTFFKPFSVTEKIPLLETSWEGGIGILRAKVQAGQTDWDLVEVESDELAIGCEENLYEKIDWSKIGGKEIYTPDAASTCGVGALQYSFVLAYDPAKTPDAPKSWADFFDLKKYPGKRALRNGPKITLEVALMADGVPAKDVYKVLGTAEGLDRAFKKLDTIKPNILWWQTGQKPIELLSSGEAQLIGVFNGRVTAANKTGKHFKMTWDQSLYTWDSWVILKGAANKDAAYRLLNYMSDAGRQSEQLKILANGLPNKKAVTLVDKTVLDDLPSAPQNIANAMEINATFWLDNFDKLSDRFTKWAAK